MNLLFSLHRKPEVSKFQGCKISKLAFRNFETCETLEPLFPIAIPVPAPRGTRRIEHLKKPDVSRFRRFQGCKEKTQDLETLKPCHPETYLLLNWKRLRAPFCPYFLRSLPRESRLTMPSAFSFFRNSALNCNSARAIPNFTASAWPRTPPPNTLATTLNVAAVSEDASGALAAERCAGVTKYSSKARPFTLKSPLPGRKYTRAIARLRRPVP